MSIKKCYSLYYHMGTHIFVTTNCCWSVYLSQTFLVPNQRLHETESTCTAEKRIIPSRLNMDVCLGPGPACSMLERPLSCWSVLLSRASFDSR